MIARLHLPIGRTRGTAVDDVAVVPEHSSEALGDVCVAVPTAGSRRRRFGRCPGCPSLCLVHGVTSTGTVSIPTAAGTIAGRSSDRVPNAADPTRVSTTVRGPRSCGIGHTRGSDANKGARPFTPTTEATGGKCSLGRTERPRVTRYRRRTLHFPRHDFSRLGQLSSGNTAFRHRYRHETTPSLETIPCFPTVSDYSSSSRSSVRGVALGLRAGTGGLTRESAIRWTNGSIYHTDSII